MQLEGLLFDQHGQLFDRFLKEARRESKLSAEAFDNKLHPKMRQIIEGYDESAIDLYEKKYTINFRKFLKLLHGQQRHIISVNKATFHYFFSYLNTGHTVYDQIVAKHSRKKYTSTETMAVALYARLLRLANEIGVLLINGYEDGALILWRTLYEQGVSLCVLLKENDDALTGRYLLHYVGGKEKQRLSFEKHRKKLKMPAVPKKRAATITDTHSSLAQQYGAEYLKNDYGWADALMPSKNKARLNDLEELIKWDQYRPFYIWASSYAHGGSSFIVSDAEKNRIILPRIIGQTDQLKSFVDPIQLTLLVLDVVHQRLLDMFSVPHEFDVNMKMFRRLHKRITDTFSTGEQVKATGKNAKNKRNK